MSPPVEFSFEDFLHRHVWSALPRKMRRSALFRITSRFAPRISPEARPTMPIIVAGVLRTASGLGQSARLCYEALKAQEIPTFAIDLSSALGQPIDLPHYRFDDGRHLNGRGTLILHVNSPIIPLALLRLGRRLVEQKWVVGYWAWELPSAPPEWHFGVPFVHEIWVPSHFTAAAVRHLGSQSPISVIPHPVSAAAPRSAARNRTKGITALVCFDMGSGFARKNPLASIAAFRKAFHSSPDAQLIVKAARSSTNPHSHKQLSDAIFKTRNAIIIDTIFQPEQMQELIAEVDILLSLHRSEGFGLVPAEAMSAGIPVVATDWSATSEFISELTGVPVAYTLVPAHDETGEYEHPQLKWAEADVHDAADKLLRLKDPVQRLRLGDSAYEYATAQFSAKVYAERVLALLGSGRAE